jgi:Rps23 Pro-64 3,4-dihydroxylase Tpa1-like proline 4-hydroxylase
LDEEYAERIYENFPSYDDTWNKYINPIEYKFSYDNIENLPDDIKKYFYLLSDQKLIKLFEKITGIENLMYDEYLHGAGLHIHPRDGKLDIHLDYEKHPYTQKERRLNVILYMSKDWDKSWGGSTELWNEDVTECVTKSEIKFNRAVIFKTNDLSWHGISEMIKCPENTYRKSMAFYYVSDLTTKKEDKDYRSKALFRKRPDVPYDENMQILYDIRAKRLLTDDDIFKYTPNWIIPE